MAALIPSQDLAKQWAAGAPKKPAASDQGYPSPGIIPSAVASTGSFMRNAKDTVKDWLAHPADSANELHDQITNQAKTGSMDMTAGSATTSGGQLQSAPVISEDQRAHEMADTGSMIAGAGVIKDVGGQWLTKGVEEALGRLKKPLAVTVGPEGEIPRDVERNKAPAALNSWIDGALRKYVLNRMATPDDEIRALAENGVLHVDPEVLTKGIPGVSGRTVVKRQGAGFPQMGVGKSEHAVAWENTADRSINAEPAGTPGMFKALPEKDQAWISKLEPETPVHESAAKSMGTNLGFDHIIDVLGEKLATGELRPEQLSKVSVADAVRMTHGYNLDAAERMSKARLASQEGMTVHKEYPEGYKWVQLDKPGQFAAESDVMGHSVRGYEPYSGDLTESSIRYGGPFEAHPDWIPASGDSGYEDYGYGGWEAIKSGKAKVYSLRDPKGESHVTVEVGKMNQYPHSGDSIKNMLGPKGDKIWEEYLASKYAGSYSPGLVRFLQDKYPKIWKGLNEGEQISQIKGKQNRKPEDKYLPYIQDFVRSSKWGDVGDVKNTGLLQVAPNKYISDAEVEALGVKHFGINGPDSTENAAQYYTRISRMHPSIRSKADEAFIKDVEQTADKPKAALAAGAAALGAAGAPKKPAASDQGYPSPGIIPSAVASTGSFMRNAKDTVKDWLAHPADSANELHDQITNQAKTGSMDMTAGSATTSGGQLQSAPVISEDQRAHEMADTGSMIAGAGVIKDVGGQWLTKGVEEALGRLKKPVHVTSKDLQAEIDSYKPGSPSAERAKAEMEQMKPREALNSWIDGALRKYVLNRMATPEDEIRKLAEDGVLHVDPEQLTSMTKSGLKMHRKDTPFPSKGLGESEHAKKWENAADTFVRKSTAGDIESGSFAQGAPYVESWISKLANDKPETPVYTALDRSRPAEVGFDHIVDVLGEKLATGELRPEQLSKVSVAEAVRMAHKYNLDAAERMSKARLASQEGMTVHKEYPEGYKWVQLDKPGQFAAESDVMGHSVRGYEPPKYQNERAEIKHNDWIPASGDSGDSGYGHGGWEAIKSGKAKVYSLRDPKGESHVTVEVHKPEFDYGLNEVKLENAVGTEKKNEIYDAFLKQKSQKGGTNDLERFVKDLGIETDQQISQIKGKQNQKPEDKYLPYIQDFVRSSKWGDVGDVKNTGLLQVAPNKYISDAEVEALGVKHFGINGPDSTENAAQYYTRISRMHPSIRSKADEAFIKDVEQTADKPKAALAAGAAALGAAGAAEASPNEKHPVTPELVDAMIQHESSGHPHARSKKGAVGLMQLMPRTAKMLGVTDRTDPVQNRKAGTKYMQQLLNEYRGDYEKALVAYNWGPHNVNKAGDNWKSKAPRSARLYARKIMQDAGLSEQLASN